ncbi:MAG: DUF2070 family protein, partial [Crenarchaeota archaeon]|nr:DUF2070 family protein [Thermoproteota archaeon]
MADEGNLNQSINKAQRHYSSMFFLPSLKKALISLFCVCLTSGMICSLAPGYPNSVFWGLAISITFFAITYTTDFILSKYILINPIFNIRRTLVLSLASWLFWFAFIAIGGVLTYFINNIWLIRFCLFGFSIVITLRTIVYFATLTVNPYKRFTAILLQPLASLVPFVIFWSTFNVISITDLLFITLLPILAI